MEIKIAELLRSAGKTQRELAESLGVPESQVSRWAKGRATPRAETAKRIAAFIGVGIEDLSGPTPQDPAVTKWLASGNQQHQSREIQLERDKLELERKVMRLELEVSALRRDLVAAKFREQIATAQNTAMEISIKLQRGDTVRKSEMKEMEEAMRFLSTATKVLTEADAEGTMRAMRELGAPEPSSSDRKKSSSVPPISGPKPMPAGEYAERVIRKGLQSGAETKSTGA